MAKSKKTVTKEDLRQRIDDEFRRWDHIHLHGCSDPAWEDGININLVRNHIIYYYRQMAEIMDGGNRMTRHSNSTLMRMTKADLIEQLRVAEQIGGGAK